MMTSDVESGVRIAPEQAATQPNGPESTKNESPPSSFPHPVLVVLGLATAATALVVSSIALARTNQLPSTSASSSNAFAHANDDAPHETLEGSPTLYDIRRRNKLNCGISITPGFGTKTTDDKGDIVYGGFDVDLCRAIAAAVFEVPPEDDPDRFISYAELTGTQRFPHLQTGEVDVLARITTHTMDRDVYIPDIGGGLTFSVPYFYDGHRFAGVPDMVDCADALDTTGDCASLKVCVNDGTTTLNQLRDLVPASNIVIRASNEETLQGLLEGECNAIFAGSNAVAEATMKTNEETSAASFAVGKMFFSHEPLALVTRDDDARWSDFVNWVLQSLLNAEEQGVTKEEYSRVPETELFGSTFALSFQNAIRAVGNYAEVYGRNLASLIPRSGLNTLNGGDTGRILSQEFGSLDTQGPLFNDGSTLDTIKQRGHVSCGISRRAGFAEFDGTTSTWSGMDADLCRAIAAAIFDGDGTRVVFHSLTASDRFEVLASGLVDLLSRITTHTYKRDILEPTTMMGFTFTQPYFYDGLSFAGVAPFSSCADRLDVTSPECQGLKICVNSGTTTLSRTSELFPTSHIVEHPTGAASLEAFADGTCNVVPGGSHDLAEHSVTKAGFVGDYELGSTRFSKEPLALVTRQDDAIWSDFVYWILEATFHAEEAGITSATWDDMPTTNLFGPLYRDMLRHAVQASGSYAEMYARNLEIVVPRAGLNLMNNGSEPQLYPLPGLALDQ